MGLKKTKIEEIGLANSIRIGRTNNYVEVSMFLKKLRKGINELGNLFKN